MAKPSGPTVSLTSLGCPKNLVDSERMLGLLSLDDAALVPAGQDADVILVNTCAFIADAEAESYEAIQHAVRLKEQGLARHVIVAGCLASRRGALIQQQIPGVDAVVPVADRESIATIVRGLTGRATPKQTPAPHAWDDTARLRLTPRGYAFLRVSEGCDRLCSFCTIPSIRGKFQSKPAETILAEARELVADGARELNLIGQDTTVYGRDIGYPGGLAALLRKMAATSGADWIRVLYAYPTAVTDDLLDVMAEGGAVVPYLDMPLQHISDTVLRRMRRAVTRSQILKLLERLRKRVPGIAIRTTLICGTPGETDADHRELLDFVRDAGFDMLGAFAYSPEAGTPMASMDSPVSPLIARQRVEEVMLLQQGIAMAKMDQWIGKPLRVLVESVHGQHAVARAAFQAPQVDSIVQVKGKVREAAMASVHVTGRNGYDLVAAIA